MSGANVPPTERTVSAIAGAALGVIGARRGGLLGALAAVLGAALVARGVSGRCPAYRSLSMRGIEVRRSIIVARSRRDVYAAVRRLADLPRFLSHLASVEEHGRTSHWVAAIGPLELEWMSEIVEEMPDLRLSWQSVPGGDLVHEGAIDLEDAPGRRGTLLTIGLRFEPPEAGVTAPFRGLARALTSHQLAIDLIRLRQLLETGEVATGARRPDELAGAERAAVAPRTGNGHGRALAPFSSSPTKAEA